MVGCILYYTSSSGNLNSLTDFQGIDHSLLGPGTCIWWIEEYVTMKVEGETERFDGCVKGPLLPSMKLTEQKKEFRRVSPTT